MNVRSLLCFCAALALGLPSLAKAQAFSAVRLGPPGTEGGIAGLALLSTPRYQGADEQRTLIAPLLDYQWRDGWFAGTVNGLGYNFSKDAKTQVGLRLTADFGRKERRSPALRGLGDVDGSLELGAFLSHRPTPHLLLSSSLRAGSAENHHGLQLDLGATQSFALSPQLHASLGLAMTLANADYLQSYFGVNPTQAAASGYATHQPGSGIRDLRASLGLSFMLDQGSSLNLTVTASTLQGDAAKSPISRERRSVSGGFAFIHRF